MPVEWGKVREYAAATAARPEYLDDPKTCVPPTFLVTATFWYKLGQSVRAPEVEEACASIGISARVRNLLSLEQEYLFHGPPPRVGDTLQISERLHDVRITRARTGPMVIVRFTVFFNDAHDGTLRAECRYTSAYLNKERR